MQNLSNNCLHRHTRAIFVGNKLLISPLEAMFGMLALIFYRDLHATPLQMVLLVSVKPIVAIFSFYGRLFLQGGKVRFKTFIAAATILGVLPCLFFPFVENAWFFLLSYALFMMAGRAAIPVWSEVLKINLSSCVRGAIFSQGASATYLMNLCVPLVIAPFLDFYPGSWRWIFFVLGVIQVFNLTLLLSMQIRATPSHASSHAAFSLTAPWREGWDLLRKKANFRRYQYAFMLGGAGLMITHPVLPAFFQDTLRVSCTELSLAISFCKGVGFALVAPIWGKAIHRLPLGFFNALFMLGAAIYGIFLIASSYHLGCLYIGYFLYGIVQAGSELSWNLSGPIFSQNEESIPYTSVNVAMVGLRGCVFPFLGGWLYLQGGAEFVFLLSSGLCLAGAYYSIWSTDLGEVSHSISGSRLSQS